MFIVNKFGPYMTLRQLTGNSENFYIIHFAEKTSCTKINKFVWHQKSHSPSQSDTDWVTQCISFSLLSDFLPVSQSSNQSCAQKISTPNQTKQIQLHWEAISKSVLWQHRLYRLALVNHNFKTHWIWGQQMDTFFFNPSTSCVFFFLSFISSHVTVADPGIFVGEGVKVAGSTDWQNLFFKFIYFIDWILLDILNQDIWIVHTLVFLKSGLPFLCDV